MDAPKLEQEFRNRLADVILRRPIQTLVSTQQLFKFRFAFLTIGVFCRTSRQDALALIEVLAPEFSSSFIEITKEIFMECLQMFDIQRQMKSWSTQHIYSDLMRCSNRWDE